MRKTLFFLSLLSTTLAFTSTVFAAAWYVPTNVRVVQKSNTDTTGRVYSNIQTAINSITGATAENPYLVKVMPGVYDLGTASLQMKPFIDVEGSGPGTTIIRSSNSNTDMSCTVGTVLMANNSAIRDIKVENLPPVLNSEYVSVAALVFNNVQAKAENISVVSGSMTVDGGQNTGISLCGESALAKLNNISVEAYNMGLGSNAIYITGGAKMTLTNSKLVASAAGQGDVTGINSDGPNISVAGSATISDTTIEVTSPGTAHGIWAGGYNALISTTKVKLNGGSAEGMFVGPTNFVMKYSTIESLIPVSYYMEPTGTASFAFCQLSSDRSGLATAKITNCIDVNGDPIPNQ